MRMTLILSGAALFLGAACFAADEKDPQKRLKKAKREPAAATDANAPASPNADTAIGSGIKKPTKAVALPAASPLVAETRSPDEVAIRQADDSFAKAYAEGDAKAVAAHFTADAEYVDELGEVSQGREAIEKSLTEFFILHADCKVEMSIASIRFISPGVAVEDGSSKVSHKEGPGTVDVPYTTVHVKTDGKWLAASVREHAPKNHRQHQAQLQKLDWLLGDWIDEGDDSVVTFSCQAADNDNFLLRKFSILIAGQETMSGTQRIGWDPLTGKLKAWIFDSEGGHAEGTWHRDGDKWILKSTGVTADGETASSTSIYTFVDAQSMTWQSVHHEVAGVQLPDSEVVTIVRQAPAPTPDEVAAESK